LRQEVEWTKEEGALRPTPGVQGERIARPCGS
jgi:hypothetical protein